MRKLTYEYVKQYFEKQGCELIEKDYKGDKTKMRYVCNCGGINEISFNNFQRGKRCKKCAGLEKHTFRYIKEYFLKYDCELLETKYVNNRTKMEYICSCKNISKIRFSNFQRGQRCPKCGGTEKHTFKSVKQYFKDQGCELLEKNYKNSNRLMSYKCSCGNKSKITFHRLKMGQRCRKCGIAKNSGKNHCNYNPNLTDEERLLKRDFKEYFYWRKRVFVRDNYTCQKCFQRGCRLNAHHIINYSTNKSLRLIDSNGITMCLSCHKQFHKKYGIKNNNQQQLDEFLATMVLHILEAFCFCEQISKPCF